MSEESTTPDLVEHVRAAIAAASRRDFAVQTSDYFDIDDGRAAAERLAEEAR